MFSGIRHPTGISAASVTKCKVRDVNFFVVIGGIQAQPTSITLFTGTVSVANSDSAITNLLPAATVIHESPSSFAFIV